MTSEWPSAFTGLDLSSGSHLDRLLRESHCAWCDAIEAGDGRLLSGLCAKGGTLPPCAPFCAIECCEPALLRQLLAYDPTTVLLRARDPRGFSPLHAAVDEEAEACVGTLLEAIGRHAVSWPGGGQGRGSSGPRVFLELPPPPAVASMPPRRGRGVLVSLASVLDARAHRCACSALSPRASQMVAGWPCLGSGGEVSAAVDLCVCVCHRAVPLPEQGWVASSASSAALALAAPSPPDRARYLTVSVSNAGACVPASAERPWRASAPASASSSALFAALRKVTSREDDGRRDAMRADARRAAYVNEEAAQAWRAPLHIALSRRNAALVLVLLQAGANALLPPKGTRRTPFDEAPLCMREVLRRGVEEQRFRVVPGEGGGGGENAVT